MSSKIIILAGIIFIVISLLLPYSLFAQSPPFFSAERGFYEEPFELLIFAQPRDFTLRYTLDGSDPRKSPTAIRHASPVTILIDPDSTTNRDLAPGFIVRACTCQEDSLFSPVVTHTYLFANKVTTLSLDGVRPGAGWPMPDNPDLDQHMDYGMDPDVFNDSRYEAQLEPAMLALPTVSLVTDLKHLFDPDSGIYLHARERGTAWERPTSVELLVPDGGHGFQINAGFRIRGGWFRYGVNPKHAFRLFFRKKYGDAKLHFAIFGDEGVDEFDKLDLRTSHNFSWSAMGDPLNTMNRDVFSRDTQRDMGQPYTRSRYYHLYLNGTYWGLYQSQERSEARYAASYFRDDRENYDVIKVSVPPEAFYEIDVTDGNMDGWNELWRACKKGFVLNEDYFKVQGLNPDGTRNPAYKVLLDIDNLIDYMLIIFYTANLDAPTDLSGTRPNNFYAIYNRNGQEGFKFFAHDNEWTFLFLFDRSGLQINLVDEIMNISEAKLMQPHYIHQRLADNQEYRFRVANRVYKHFFNQGTLTPAACTMRFMARANEINQAIIAESARWGDAKVDTPLTKNDHWLPAINDIVDNWFPYRTNIVINQLKAANLYPYYQPPCFQEHTRIIETDYLKVKAGFPIILINPNNDRGDIYYTVDGTDPRLIGGAIANQAINGADRDTMTISTTTVLKARVNDSGKWSALHEITLAVEDEDLTKLKITEIHYHPLDAGTISGRELEFIELKNSSARPLNLTHVRFITGIDYLFPAGTILNSGSFIVLASNMLEFSKRYGFTPFGEYGGQLNNGGERINTISAVSDTLFSFKYSDQPPWPPEADGKGYSLVINESVALYNPADPTYWRVSYQIHGSPGRDDAITFGPSLFGKKSMNYSLKQNYPNPFNQVTNIHFSVPERVHTTITIINVYGQIVETLLDETVQAGVYRQEWDAKDLATGIYFCRMQADNFLYTIKLIMVK